MSNILMQLIQKPTNKPSGANRKPLLLDSSVVSVLEKMAADEGVSEPVMLRRMVERVLASDTATSSVLYYIHDHWWGYNPSGDRAVIVRVDSETFSLLLYLSHTSGFSQNTDQTAEMLVSFFSQHEKRVTLRPYALAAGHNQHLTSTQPQV